MLPLDLTLKLRKLYLDRHFADLSSNWRMLPPMLGLDSIDTEGYWSHNEEEGYLKIVDKEKFLWARLKYGF